MDIVSDPSNIGINEDGFNFTPASSDNPLYDDGTLVSSFYGVEYKTIKDTRKTRVILKAILTSNKQGVTPELNSYTLILNPESDVELPIEQRIQSIEGSTYAI